MRLHPGDADGRAHCEGETEMTEETVSETHGTVKRAKVIVKYIKVRNGLWHVLVNDKVARRLSSKPAAQKSASDLARYFDGVLVED